MTTAMPTTYPRRLPLLALAFVGVALLLGGTRDADAAPKKKYHFELHAVLTKPEVKGDVAKVAIERVRGQLKKAFETHPQLVATLEGAPPKTSEDAYRKFLKKKGISNAYLVTVEITNASIEIVPVDGKPNTNRIAVKVALHMLGENMPGRTMGFTGDGSATVKQEVGKTIRDKDKQYTWDGAAEAAIADALTTVFKQLALPPKQQSTIGKKKK